MTSHGRKRVVLLGGGHGVAAVAGALDAPGIDLTAIVSVADDGGSSGELRRRWGGPAVGDMRRSFIALSGDQAVVARAFERRLALAPFGEHPLGNLLLRSVAGALGDLETASAWLAEHLGIRGRVLPGTVEPITLLGETVDGLIRGESSIGTATAPIKRLRFDPARPASPQAAIDAIQAADWVLIGPGSLYTSVLAVAALPDIAAALRMTPARVLWICNLEADRGETLGMTGADHLRALRDHGVRIDAALHDPRGRLTIVDDGDERPVVFSLALEAGERGVHDTAALRAALTTVFAARRRPRAIAGAPSRSAASIAA